MTTHIVCDVCDSDVTDQPVHYEITPVGDTTYEDPPAMDVCRGCVVIGLDAARGSTTGDTQ